MRFRSTIYLFAALLSAAVPICSHAQSFSDVTHKDAFATAITTAIKKGWMKAETATTFGYGKPITPDDWLYLLMFERTSDACPELGLKPSAGWTANNIRSCLSGAGVPVETASPTEIRRDEAMQQLFALRRQSFAFQQLRNKPAGFVDPTDLANVPTNRQGAMIASIRLKLIFTTKNKILPAAPLLREDAALAVTRFVDWEAQSGVDGETHDQQVLNPGATLEHWRDLDTNIYVIQVKTGSDSEIRPILPRRSFNPAPADTKTAVRDEYVYEPVSVLAQESSAVAAVNGSYFNVQWPWGALEDVAIVDGKEILTRTDRSTFIVCSNGKMYVTSYDAKRLKTLKCAPQQALGAGPLFMSDGSVLATSTKEGFDEYTAWERRVGSNARTAVAVSGDHRTAYIIVVAGKSYPAFGRGGNSLGTFLKSKYPDMSDAMMFDGGNSTALFASGKLLVGTGEDGNLNERSVVSALGVFSKKTEAAVAKQSKKEKAARWDAAPTVIKQAKPTTPFAWQTVKQAKNTGETITLAGSRGSTIKVVDPEDKVKVLNLTFDLFAHDATSSLMLARREGVHEKDWHIPTEIHVINPKDGSDTDIIRLFAYIPAADRPDLKTFDAVAFGKTGIFFGDASGRSWFYWAKNKQLSLAEFKPPAKAKTKTKAKTDATASKKATKTSPPSA